MQQEILQLIAPLGITELTPIQEEAIHNFQNFDEIVLYAPTGTGKTLAFLIPLVQLLKQHPKTKNQVRALILSPTRELATQIESVFKSLKTEFSITACYGGHSIQSEINSLSAFPDVVVGTPGRLVDHIDRRSLEILNTEFLVIDEFDKCLEMGFQEQIAWVYGEIRNLKKTFFGSATKLDVFPVFMKLVNPIFIDKTQQDVQPEFSLYHVKSGGDKLQTLVDLVTNFRNERAIIFCNFRENVDEIASFFNHHKMAITAYHGGLEQDERERALIKFRNNTAPVMVCTDIGSRGLDISEVKHIVHYQFPDKEDAFIHRNGRTARMAETGCVYWFDEDYRRAKFDLPKSQEFVIDQSIQYKRPNWTTIYFSAGKKNKINKVDLLGFLFKQGELQKNQIGVIAVLDYTSYVGVDVKDIGALLSKLRSHKVKSQKLKIDIAY